MIEAFQGPSLIEWMPGIQLDGHLPTKTIPRSRPYSHVAYDTSTSLLVAASSVEASFTSYDEDGNVVWEPDCVFQIRFSSFRQSDATYSTEYNIAQV